MRLFTKFTGWQKMSKTKILLSALFVFLCGLKAEALTWTNDLRPLFINNKANIYALNLRTFGADDYNKNDIIEIELGEKKGTFINAIPKLKPLRQAGFNTIYLLPVTKVGKLKALGNAGSLYAMDAFDVLNPQLYDETDLTPDIVSQAKKFVNEAHKLGLHVMADLPSSGSYDMSLEKPELFLKDKNGNTIIPADWTDVRIFKVYNDDKTLNKSLIEEHKKFIDLMQEIGIDGIRADVAAIKPYEFWVEIINYAREKDPAFLFLAEASPKWSNPAKDYTPYASVEELLKAGFDGYYSDWSDLSQIKTNSDLYNKINNELKLIKGFDEQKSFIANFATHDQISPASKGYQYWQMVNWLNAMLPLNPYTLDGFPSADTYKYLFENKKADKTYTDCNTYFVHKNQLDIFNFSRAPYSLDSDTFVKEFASAQRLRYMMLPSISQKEFKGLPATNPSIFAFMKQDRDEMLIIAGNLNPKEPVKGKIKLQNLSKDAIVMPFKMFDAPILKRGGFELNLRPYEVQVFAVKN